MVNATLDVREIDLSTIRHRLLSCLMLVCIYNPNDHPIGLDPPPVDARPISYNCS